MDESRAWCLCFLFGALVGCGPVGVGLDGGQRMPEWPDVDEEPGPQMPDMDGGSDAGVALEDAGLEQVQDAGLEATDASVGPIDASVADAGVQTDAGRSIGTFVAVGNVGRTIASFDDGRSWTADRSDMAGVICTVVDSTTTDRDHFCYEGTKAARGIAFLDGAFFTTFDWSREPDPTNSVRKSTNGRDWVNVLTPGGFGGIAAGNGVVVLGGPSGSTYTMRSTNQGATWQQVSNGFGNWINTRRLVFLPAFGGRFLLGGNGNGLETTRALVSTNGMGWVKPTSVAGSCPSVFAMYGGFGYVGNRLVMVGSDGATCHSDTGGQSWVASASVGRPVRSHDVISTGTRVYVWSAGRVHFSDDGRTWTERALTPANASIGAVARNPETGTFVAVTAGYSNGYSAQRFYRSSDGISWTELASSNYVKSHPIIGIAFGRTRLP